MRLVVLGCAGSFPGPDSAASGYLVQADDADGRTWTVLLAEGKAPVLKRGSVGEPVRRVQRGLTAALDRKVAVTGVFDAATTSAVLAYQQRRGLVRTGVMADDTWAQLVAGRI